MENDNKFCLHHDRNMLRLETLETNITKLEGQWDEKFKAFKDAFDSEIEKIVCKFEAKVDELMKMYNTLNLTITRIELMFNDIKKELDRLNENKKDTKTKILYPVIVSTLSLIFGAIIGVIVGALKK